MDERNTTCIRVRKTTHAQIVEIAKTHSITTIELVADLVRNSKKYKQRGSG